MTARFHPDQTAAAVHPGGEPPGRVGPDLHALPEPHGRVLDSQSPLVDDAQRHEVRVVMG